MNASRSKWTILQERQQAAYVQYREITRELEGLEGTPCIAHSCLCGQTFETEADFARHFEVRKFDEINNHLNLGWCPVIDKVRV